MKNKNIVYLPLKPITDTDPVVLKFKNVCLQEMGQPRYVSWVQPLVMNRTPSGEIKCVAPTPWFAQYISTNDTFNFGAVLNEIKIPAVLITKPNGELVGKIFARNESH